MIALCAGLCALRRAKWARKYGSSRTATQAASTSAQRSHLQDLPQLRSRSCPASRTSRPNSSLFDYRPARSRQPRKEATYRHQVVRQPCAGSGAALFIQQRAPVSIACDNLSPHKALGSSSCSQMMSSQLLHYTTGLDPFFMLPARASCMSSWSVFARFRRWNPSLPWSWSEPEVRKESPAGSTCAGLCHC
jgi:hypothetical protein